MLYQDFLASKKHAFVNSGFKAEVNELNPLMFEWQKYVTRWAIQKGKAALFLECGAGKSICQLEWGSQVSRQTSKPVLILAPLAVSAQTVREGAKFNYSVNICRSQSDIVNGINIANYEIMDRFDAETFAGIILDESSILKHHGAKTRQWLTEAYVNTPYKLCCTATPAPNDFMELGNHSEFLGVMKRTEMLATYFVHDGGETQTWRLKRHASDAFWAWVASWGCVIEKPSDIGFESAGYDLPELRLHEHVVKSNNTMLGDQYTIFATEAQTLLERRQARRNSLSDRVSVAAEIANSTDKQVLVWCDLNSESDNLTRSIQGAVEVKGADSGEHKVNSMIGFAEGSVRVLVSKPSIAGYGMNWQNCSKMIFVGLSDSWEMYYQAVRRCWRFGQTQPVDVHIVSSESEGAVRANIQRKEKQAAHMKREMIKHTRAILEQDIKQTKLIKDEYLITRIMEVPAWLKEELAC
ncbi:DEAD/DEAH box helicase [Clostridia bacterium]|nr:DEAD/DEAH box helicase [Clostridia bacterium]